MSNLCKICGEKRATKTHLLSAHNLSKEEYTRQYEPEAYEQEQILNELNALYVRRRDKYIVFNRKIESWQTLTANTQRRIPPLTDRALQQHLRGESCYGIVSNSATSHLIVFDIDMNPTDSLTALKLLTDELKRLGVSEEQMLCSWSGRRGFHVALFFEEEVSKAVLVSFYESIREKLGYSKQELEGKAIGGQGVKLPLGINFKNKDLEYDNFCYLVTSEGEKILNSLDRLQNVEKVPVSFFYDLSSGPEISPEKLEIAQNALSEIEREIAGDEYYYLTADVIDKWCEHKLKFGIEASGTRHNTTLYLAVWMKDRKKLSREDTKKRLFDWTANVCSKKYYKTALNEVQKEINDTVNTVFKYDNYRIREVKKHITLTAKDQMNIVFDAQGKILNKTDMKAMFIHARHSKVYANDAGIYYMTYDTFREISKQDTKNKVLKQRFEKLQLMNKLQIVSSNVVRDNHTFMKKPNTYRIIGADNENSLQLKKEVKDIEVCTCSSLDLDKLIDTLKANVTGKAGRRPKLCKCKQKRSS